MKKKIAQGADGDGEVDGMGKILIVRIFAFIYGTKRKIGIIKFQPSFRDSIVKLYYENGEKNKKINS